MSDTDTTTHAWSVSPSQYLERRQKTHAVAAPTSRYLIMRDGCRIAIDVYLPEGALPEGGVPAILILTPYYRRFARTPGSAAEPTPNAARYRDAFVPYGYALVVVDVRGTGASFGTRDSFRSPTERDDFTEIADAIAAEPWCNGRLGSTGISYLGAASCFLATTGHPAVKAIAPLFAVWNTWVDHQYPGGVRMNTLPASYDRLMIGLDHDRRDILAETAYFGHPDYRGPQPVDEDDGTLLAEAIAEHRNNFHMPDFIGEFPYADSTLAYDDTFGAFSFSPYHYSDAIRPDCAIYNISGWMDGAGFANGAIARHLTLPNPQHLLLGPWDHGARTNVSPWRAETAAQFPLYGEILRFFDTYLMERDTGLKDEAPVHYFALHEEAWHAAPSWPPAPAAETLHLAAEGALGAANGTGTDVWRADFNRGTGLNTRHERLAAIATTTYYDDWGARMEGLSAYTSAPLAAPLAVAGHPVIEVTLSADQGDAVLFAYLCEVEADGTVRYVTEGHLRALHRTLAEPDPRQVWSWPFRDYCAASARPLTPGAPEVMRFALLPTAWEFAAGSRIRLAFAGADADHYVQLPHGRPPMISIHYGADTGSRLELPVQAPTAGDVNRKEAR
ncbi:CocE/NonD family hydrolase [Acuticoccus sp. I52.16.1]|uniref:CocE/NonD family hydrolase n=1 Tax=Acuticoccus sp. I52.16.1 TaxID=2928472 RepID=UPI001FD3BF0F|nr:CocE/NonD family hydrolase [Acuticoccus sp. I52.16.1]UOM34388.1 CocE/NonD family hydrolase [Acuticoccus sp. I52.16.1]